MVTYQKPQKNHIIIISIITVHKCECDAEKYHLFMTFGISDPLTLIIRINCCFLYFDVLLLISAWASTGGKWMQLSFNLVQERNPPSSEKISLRYMGLSQMYFISPSVLMHRSHLQLGLGVPKFLMFVHHCSNFLCSCSCIVCNISIVFTRDSIYAIARICYGNSVCLSVRLSVTRVDQSKTVEARITQFSPYSSPIPLVFRG